MKNFIKLQNLLKNQKGSVTLFVLISMLFFLIITLTWYTNASNKLNEQQKEIKIIQSKYNSSNMEEAYRKATTVSI